MRWRDDDERIPQVHRERCCAGTRFQTIKVDAPTVDEAIQILKGLRPKYEAHHKAKLTDEALETAVRFSDRYITGRFLPDKAIDVMDEAGARARINSMTRPPDVKDIEKEIEAIRLKKKERSRPRILKKPLRFATRRSKQGKTRCHFDQVARRTRREGSRRNRRRHDAHHLESHGRSAPEDGRAGDPEAAQNGGGAQRARHRPGEAVTAISKALRRSRADLKDPKRPIGSFVFLGPTGSAKPISRARSRSSCSATPTR
jgi:ATPases with chaperone activity, ATP-binding subunit